MQWIKLTDRMPNPDEHGRVLIYTEGHDFNGEQVFDVQAETLNECFYADPEDQPEECKVASHWMPHPSKNGSPNWTGEQKAANALHDLMDALPSGTQTSMTVFRPEVNGRKEGAVKAFLMADNPDDLRAAQWVIAHGSVRRGEGDEGSAGTCHRRAAEGNRPPALDGKEQRRALATRKQVGGADGARCIQRIEPPGKPGMPL